MILRCACSRTDAISDVAENQNNLWIQESITLEEPKKTDNLSSF